MVTIEIKARTGADGILHIDVPTGLPETDIEGHLVMAPVADIRQKSEPSGSAWPQGFFEATAGRWHGDLERGEQGDYSNFQ